MDKITISMKSIKFPKVSIIILNWNGWEDTIECLESVYQSNYSNYNVIVVDNCSDDDSLNKIKYYCEGKIKVQSDFFVFDKKNKPICTMIYEDDELEYSNLIKIQSKFKSLNKMLTIIKNKKNYGFAKGNNIGIKYAFNAQVPDYIFLLNNDTVIDKDALLNLVKLGESSEEIGVIGSKIYYYKSDGQKNLIQSTGGKINFSKYPGYYPINYNSIDEGRNIKCEEDYDWVTGAAMMLKVRKNKTILLNTEFFFGCEDLDLCINLKKEGFKIAVSLDSKIWHKIGKSRQKKYHNMDKGFFDILIGRTQNVKTNLKWLKKHNIHYYRFLPFYIPSIMICYSSDILMRFKSSFKRKD